jgi:glucose-6-phosphate 1-dehydrogenase
MDPVLGNVVPLSEYEPGSWGPDASEALIAGNQAWHDPHPEESP